MNVGLFANMGYSKIERRNLYYLICIFLRLLIAGIVYNFADNKIIQYIILAFSIVAIYSNYNRINDNKWWSSKFHLLVAILLVIVFIFVKLNKIQNTKYLAYLLYIDVIGGFLYSLYLKPFD